MTVTVSVWFPSAAGSKVIVKEVFPEGAIEVAGKAVTEKWVPVLSCTAGEPDSSKKAAPVLKTVKLRATLPVEIWAAPKSVPSKVLGVESPSVMTRPLP